MTLLATKKLKLGWNRYLLEGLAIGFNFDLSLREMGVRLNVLPLFSCSFEANYGKHWLKGIGFWVTVLGLELEYDGLVDRCNDGGEGEQAYKEHLEQAAHAGDL